MDRLVGEMLSQVGTVGVCCGAGFFNLFVLYSPSDIKVCYLFYKGAGE